MNTLTTHWDNIFNSTEDSSLGWFEKETQQTLKFFNTFKDQKTVFISGVGTSTIVEKLLERDYQLILNDLSQNALDKLEKRVQSDKAIYLCQNIATPLPQNTQCDIWFDRAVLHFLLKEEEIEQYFQNLKNTLNNGGYALFAEFALDGTPKCAGLELHRYSVKELVERLGEGFELIESENYNYINPAGDTRKYIYALFRKTVS